MSYEVKQVKDLHNVSLDTLVKQSEEEGYRFLGRLVQQYEDGSQRFEKPGEALYGVWKDSELIAIGGVRQNPYSSDQKEARLKRFYVAPEQRRHGIGSQLLETCISKAKENFHSITCRTDSAKADAFYRHNGFEAVLDSVDTTHRITFS